MQWGQRQMSHFKSLIYLFFDEIKSLIYLFTRSFLILSSTCSYSSLVKSRNTSFGFSFQYIPNDENSLAESYKYENIPLTETYLSLTRLIYLIATYIVSTLSNKLQSSHKEAYQKYYYGIQSRVRSCHQSFLGFSISFPTPLFLFWFIVAVS